MFRKFAVGAGVVALGLSGLAMTAGPAFAKTPVNASGSLHCTISGKVKISPNALLLSSNRGPSTFTAKWKSSSCTGSSGVTGAKGTLTATLPSSDCLALQAIPLPNGTVTKVKYKGANKYTAGDFSFSAGGAFTISDPLLTDIPGAGTSTVAPGHSFAGQHPTFHLVVTESVTTFATNCTPKTKGLKGSGGLKKMSFAGASSFDIS